MGDNDKTDDVKTAGNKEVGSQTLGYVLIHKDLLSGLLANTVECYNNGTNIRSRGGVLSAYQDEIDQIKKLLEAVKDEK